MKKVTKGIIAGVAVILVGTTLVACGFHAKTPQERADYMVNKITKKLDLAPIQVAELEKLSSTLLEVRSEFSGQRETLHNTIDQLLSQPTLDQQRLVDLIKSQTEIVNQKAPVVVASAAEFYNSLTPEQQARLKEKVQSHRDEHRHWHH